MSADQMSIRIALSLLIFGIASAADPLDDVRRGEALAKAGKRGTEIGEIIADLAKVQPDGKFYVGILQARVLAADGKAEQAKQALAGALPKGGAEALTTDEQFAYADTLRSLGSHAEAMAIANRIGSAGTGMNRVRAAEMMGDLSADRQRWQEAVDWLKSAIANFDALSSSDSTDKPYRAVLVAKLARLRDCMDLATHGLGFVLYQTANAQRFGKRFAEALVTYDRLLELHRKNQSKPVIPVTGLDDPKVNDLPIHELYAAASQVYRAYALIGLMKYKEATLALAPVAQDAKHPYRGEAMRLLGDIALEDDGDVATAEAKYTAAIKVLSDDGVQARSIDRFHVPAVSAERTKPPDAMRSVQGWGNLEWFHPEPGQVFNADSCSWYTSYQLLLAQTKRSICYFITGNSKAAIQDIAIITQIDTADKALTNRNQPSNYLRLRDGYRSGRLFATQVELDTFKGKVKAKIVQADVLFETEQWQEAVAAYDHISADASTSLSIGARAYLDFARASAYLYSGDRKLAEIIAAGFKGDKSQYAKTSTYWRAQFLLANLDQKLENEILEQGFQKCPDRSMQVDFALRLGQLAFTGGRADTAKLWFNRISTLVPSDDFRHKAAIKYIEIIEDQSKH